MKVFQRNRTADFQTLVRQTQEKVYKESVSNPKELVAVRNRMGGYDMQLKEVPAGQNYVLAK